MTETDGAESGGDAPQYDLPKEFERADPEEVDKDAVMAMGDCPNCGEHSLATVEVTNAEYIASCASCDQEKRGPVVVNEDGEELVKLDVDPIEGGAA